MRLFTELTLTKEGEASTFRFFGRDLVWRLSALEMYAQQVDCSPRSSVRYLCGWWVVSLQKNFHWAANQLLKAHADVDLYQQNRGKWILVTARSSRIRLGQLLSGRDLSARVMQGVITDNSPATIPITRTFKLV